MMRLCVMQHNIERENMHGKVGEIAFVRKGLS